MKVKTLEEIENFMEEKAKELEYERKGVSTELLHSFYEIEDIIMSYFETDLCMDEKKAEKMFVKWWNSEQPENSSFINRNPLFFTLKALQKTVGWNYNDQNIDQKEEA